MDSCHLFRFLFDTKKAKSELSKCFGAFRDRLARENGHRRPGQKQRSRSRSPSTSTPTSAACQNETGDSSRNIPISPASAPSTPLKQIRPRISNFSPSPSTNPHENLKNGEDQQQLVSASSTMTTTVSRGHKQSVHNNDSSNLKNIQPDYDQTLEPQTSTTDAGDCEGQSTTGCVILTDGTYRANLVQSVSFEQDSDIVIREAPIKQSFEQPSQLNDHFLKQLLTQQEIDNAFTSITTTSTTTDIEGSSDGLNNDDNKIDNNNNELVMKRVILYSGNDDEDHHSGSGKLPNVCSTAEVFNMVDTDHYIVNGDSDVGANDDLEGYSQDATIASSASFFDRTTNNNSKINSTTSTRSSFRERGRSSSLVRTLVQSFEDRHGSTSHSLDLPDTSRASFSSANPREGATQGPTPLNGRYQRADDPNACDMLDGLLNSALDIKVIADNDNNNNDNGSSTSATNTSAYKPFKLVKPLPPKAPPKSIRAKCITLQLNLDKPSKVDKLFTDNDFLKRFFLYLEPLDRCRAAQVCRQWRDIIYSNPILWRDLTLVIDYCQLRRDLVLDCIISTLESLKFSNLNNKQMGPNSCNQAMRNNVNNNIIINSNHTNTNNITSTCNVKQQATNHLIKDSSLYDITTSSTNTTAYSMSERNSNDMTLVSSRESSPSLSELDSEDIWRIQELCNKLANRPFTTTNQTTDAINNNSNNNNNQQQNQQQQQFTRQSTSIPSQISSTLSSASLSSLLSPPLSDGSHRMELAKERLYESISRRQFDSICLSGACNDDLGEFLAKFGASKTEDGSLIALSRVKTLRLHNTLINDKVLAHFLSNFNNIIELDLTLCNCISNQIDLTPLKRLRSLTIQDCINITDDFAEVLAAIANQLEVLNIHAYHISDFFPDYLGSNCDMSNLRCLRFPFCRELTDRSLMSIGKHYNSLEILDLSGTKISDDGIDFLANRAPTLKSLDLGWCANITDASIDFLALDLSETLTELVLDRNLVITDRAMKQLVKMSRLRSLHLRWCVRITDIGIEHLILIDSLRYLFIAGLHQITSRSLMKLPQTNLLGLELTNCQAVNSKLIALLSDKMPNCNITH